jgi:hypothetical protein
MTRDEVEAALPPVPPNQRWSRDRRLNGIENYLDIGGDRMSAEAAAQRLGVSKRTALRRNLTETGVPASYHDAVVGAFLAELLPSRAPVHLITAAFTLACGHDGHDPASYVRTEVTCAWCLAGAS